MHNTESDILANCDVLIRLEARDDWGDVMPGQIAIEPMSQHGRNVLGIRDDAIKALVCERDAGIRKVRELTEGFKACAVKML